MLKAEMLTSLFSSVVIMVSLPYSMLLRFKGFSVRTEKSEMGKLKCT